MSSAELDLAGRVVEIVRRVAGAEAEAEVIADHTALALTRFANSRIHQNVADATTTVRLRLHVDGRTAAGASTVVDADGLAGLVERTLAAARLCPPDPGWAGLAPPAPVGPRRRVGRDDRDRRPRRSAPTGYGRSSTPPAAWRPPATAAPCTGRPASPTPAGRR